MLDMLQSSPFLTRATSESIRRKDEKLKVVSFILIFAFVFIFIFGITFMYLELYSNSIAIANIQNYIALALHLQIYKIIQHQHCICKYRIIMQINAMRKVIQIKYVFALHQQYIYNYIYNWIYIYVSRIVQHQHCIYKSI